MKKWILKEYISFGDSRILVPLVSVINRLNLNNIYLWSFKKTEIFGDTPIDVDPDTFSKITWKLNFGSAINNEDFQKYIQKDFQIIDGFICGYTKDSLEIPFITIEAFDSTLWVIELDDQFTDEELLKKNFTQEVS